MCREILIKVSTKTTNEESFIFLSCIAKWQALYSVSLSCLRRTRPMQSKLLSHTALWLNSRLTILVYCHIRETLCSSVYNLKKCIVLLNNSQLNFSAALSVALIVVHGDTTGETSWLPMAFLQAIPWYTRSSNTLDLANRQLIQVAQLQQCKRLWPTNHYICGTKIL